MCVCVHALMSVVNVIPIVKSHIKGKKHNTEGKMYSRCASSILRFILK